MSEQQKIIQLWKENGVANIDYEFDCGGDSMGETTLNILDKEGELIECKEIEDYFENKIYDNVDFYVNSDGHYIGERGNVYIYLEENEGEPYFDYSKSSTEEYEEFEGFDEYVEMTEEEINYINLYVSNINVDWGNDANFNYKNDFIKTDRHEELEKSIAEKISDYWDKYEPEVLGELIDGQDENWNTNENDDELETKGNTLKVILYFRSYVYIEGNS
jgi:hypothetical protein